jgi:hypothetical protein
MDIYFAIHIVIALGILSVPFLPIQLLEYGIYIPLIVSLVWVVFDGCPLSRVHDTGEEAFVLYLVRLVFPGIKPSIVSHFNTFLFILITLIGGKRLLMHKSDIPATNTPGISPEIPILPIYEETPRIENEV